MTLSAQQKADARRFAGYPAIGDVPTDQAHDWAFGVVAPWTWETLGHRLDTLQAPEEAILIGYLTALTGFETAIIGTSDNLDTAKASVWEHNPNELADRIELMNTWARRMCDFLGIPPGPGLGGNQPELVRG